MTLLKLTPRQKPTEECTHPVLRWTGTGWQCLICKQENISDLDLIDQKNTRHNQTRGELKEAA